MNQGSKRKKGKRYGHNTTEHFEKIPSLEINILVHNRFVGQVLAATYSTQVHEFITLIL